LGIAGVTVRTFVGCVLVNEDEFIADKFCLSVAFVAGNIGVATGKRQASFSVVIKGGGDPLGGGVAIGAVGLAVF
jgi:hypothetical protein